MPEHPTDSILDQLLSPQTPTGKPGQTAVGIPPAYQHPTDAVLDKMLAPRSELEEQLAIHSDPGADWDGARQAYDAALFGKYSASDPKLTKAKAAWESAHGPATVSVMDSIVAVPRLAWCWAQWVNRLSFAEGC